MTIKKISPTIFLVIAIALAFNKYAVAGEKPIIFPVPSEVQLKEGKFNLDKSTFLLLPENSTEADAFLTSFIANEFADRYRYSLNTIKKTKITNQDKFILVGSLSNPFVRNYCEQKGLTADLKKLGDEGYILSVSDNQVVIASNSRNGALMGLSSFRQIIHKENGDISIPQLIVKDSPKHPFRGIKLYLPGRENITFFKRFIKDFVSLYKYNKIVLELNANMRLDKHPELNIGAVEFAEYMIYNRVDGANGPSGPHGEMSNSSHHDNADGGILEKDEVADLVKYMRKFGVEVIPELPSLAHSYYLLGGHKDLAENKHYKYPDTYCPSNPAIYKIYFDVLDEYIDVIKPSMIHIGRDEWRIEKDVCELCRGKDYSRLFIDDLNKIYGYLAKKSIKVAIWGDRLLESVAGVKENRFRKTPTGYEYTVPEALTPDQVLKLIPKDILIFNWFYDDIKNDKQVADFGFKQVYGNFGPHISEWNERIKIKGVIGAAPSSWAGTTEMNFGKDQISDFLGSASLLWSNQDLPYDQLSLIVEPMISGIYRDWSGKLLPTDRGSKVNTINISSYFDSPLSLTPDGPPDSMLLTGEVKAGNQVFNLDAVKKAVVAKNKKDNTGSTHAVKINKDASSILFLHASISKGKNQRPYFWVSNPNETADLLGWYEVVYEDGFIETIPLRYGVNILDWRWKKRIINKEKIKDWEDDNPRQQTYAYQARAVECSKDKSDPVTFFSFEWKNTRFGKSIKEIKLKASENNEENGIILLAVSVAEN